MITPEEVTDEEGKVSYIVGIGIDKTKKTDYK